MKIYGVTEIARALGKEPDLVSKWYNRGKLPAPDGVISAGPVWLAKTIEPVIERGGPEPRPPGGRVQEFKVTARVTPGRYPQVTDERRRRFEQSMGSLDRGLNKTRTSVKWKSDGTALVVMGGVGIHEESAETGVKGIIMRRAQYDAEMGIDEVAVVSTEHVGEWPVLR
jgi:hypothetical protein